MQQFSQKQKYTGKSALLVEPTDNLRKAQAKILRELGVKTILHATKLIDAKRILEKTTPDVIVSEWDLEDGEGLELLSWCRDRDETAQLPFIICASVVEQSTVLQALQAGVSEFIAKPFSRAIFEKHIDKAINQPLNSRFEQQDSTESGLGHHQLSIAQYSQRLSKPKKKEFTILVVDDNPINIDFAAQTIKSMGKVRFATSGAKALEVCEDFSPDLVLLDIMMPEMDGYQVFQALQDNPLTESIPVIFLTAKSEDEEIAKGLQMGAVDYITKPFNPKILQARVANQKRSIEVQNALQDQVEGYIENYALKADLERLLFDHMQVPLKTLNEISEHLHDSAQVRESFALYKVKTTIERLVESLSGMVKLEDRDFQPNVSAVDLNLVLKLVTANHEKERDDKNLSVNLDTKDQAIVLGDDILLYTLFSNLYLNAIEAAPKSSQIRVIHKKQGDINILTFANDGAVPANIQDRFFDKYVTHGKVNGTGLGTYTAKLIAEGLGGGIKLDAREKETRIHVALKDATRVC